MLDERKRAILRAVVTEHVATGLPVGSSHVTGRPGVDVSPATVRAEMVQLERDGYLVQPYTSAGRVPTDKGYRCFVDALDGHGELQARHSRLVLDFFSGVHGELGQLLDATSKLLAGLTGCTAVVVEPAHDAAVVRSVQLVALGGGRAVVVVVLSDGAIEKRTIEVAGEVTELHLAEASAWLTAQAAGRALVAVSTLATRPAADRGGPSGAVPGDPVVRRACRQALGALGSDHDGGEVEQVFVGGASRMADVFDAVETMRAVLVFLEQQYAVVGLLRGILARGQSVAIGSEHGFAPLVQCSVVVAPFAMRGHPAGTVGVLGPTRMNYPLALAAVAAVGERLSARLGAA